MMVCGNMDAHARPPESLRRLFKKCQKDSNSPASDEQESKIRQHEKVLIEQDIPLSHHAFRTVGSIQFLGYETPDPPSKYFEVKGLPGLYIYPSLLSLAIQRELLERLLHRDLSDPRHKTNLHAHYYMPFDSPPPNLSTTFESRSFFDLSKDLEIMPIDANVHKPLTAGRLLEKKLRWATLGGQYNWTTKKYPEGQPPEFPEDISSLLQSFFENIDPQAAILNLYSPGDTLSLHRDVSEECDVGLISISIGCTALFLVGNHDGSESVVLPLRSGDAIVMSGASRFAWHAVPKVLADTCPEGLKSWPAGHADARYSRWQNWMANKRINLNVRQMRA